MSQETTNEVLDKLAAQAFDLALNICPDLFVVWNNGGKSVDCSFRRYHEPCRIAIVKAFQMGFTMGFIECNSTSRDDAYDENDVLKPLTVEDVT